MKHGLDAFLLVVILKTDIKTYTCKNSIYTGQYIMLSDDWTCKLLPEELSVNVTELVVNDQWMFMCWIVNMFHLQLSLSHSLSLLQNIKRAIVLYLSCFEIKELHNKFGQLYNLNTK